jgi:hypothetical protein
VTWVREQAGIPIGPAAAARLARRAWLRDRLPTVTALHERGLVSGAFLDAAGARLEDLPAEAWPTVDGLLAGDARVLEPAQVRGLVAQVRAMVDPDGTDLRADTREGCSVMWLSPLGSDGGWDLKGTLYGMGAERLAGLLNSWSRRRPGRVRWSV